MQNIGAYNNVENPFVSCKKNLAEMYIAINTSKLSQNKIR